MTASTSAPSPPPRGRSWAWWTKAVTFQGQTAYVSAEFAKTRQVPQEEYNALLRGETPAAPETPTTPVSTAPEEDPSPAPSEDPIPEPATPTPETTARPSQTNQDGER